MTPLSLKDAFKSAWDSFTKNPTVLVTITLAFFVLGIIISSVRDQGDNILVSIANALVSFLAAYVMVKISLAATEGKHLSWKEALSIEARPFWYFILASILVGLINVAGFVLLIIPGFFFLVRLSLFNFAVVDEDLSPAESIKHSWALTRGHFWILFLAGLMIVGMNIVGILLLGVGVLVSSPLSFLFSVYIYRNLKAASIPVVE